MSKDPVIYVEKSQVIKVLQRVLITKLYAGMKRPNFEPLFVCIFCANLNVQRCKLEKQHIQFVKETLRKHSDIQMNFLQELLKSKFPKLNISRQYLFFY